MQQLKTDVFVIIAKLMFCNHCKFLKLSPKYICFISYCLQIVNCTFIIFFIYENWKYSRDFSHQLIYSKNVFMEMRILKLSEVWLVRSC